MRRGLDLPIPGAPAQVIEPAPRASAVALLGEDWPGVHLSVEVQTGERVKLGQTLFTDSRRTAIRFTSPAAGRVSAVLRGQMRRLSAVVIEPDGDDAVTFPALAADAVRALPRRDVSARLLESGEWVALRARPFGSIPDPDPDSSPAAIFVRAMDTNPLAPRAPVVLSERPLDLDSGLAALARLTDGPVFVCCDPGWIGPLDLERVRVVEFEGPHPAGLPGTHIHHLLPVHAARRVWYLGYQDVLSIGHLFRTGRPNPERVISLAGPSVRRPRLLRTRLGASSADLVSGELAEERCRVVSGSVLAGRRAGSREQYLGRYEEQLCALPEREDLVSRAWLLPGGRRGRRFPPWLPLPEWTSALRGEPHAFLPLDLFRRVVPLDLPVIPLLRALAAGDADGALSYGALELQEEDLALCSFLCPSKLEYGALLRRTLAELETQLA